MKTDTNERALLELAALAAGKTVLRYEHGYGVAIEGSGRWWNPLADDGEALRLAVELEMDLCIGLLTVVVQSCGASMRSPRGYAGVEDAMRDDEPPNCMVRRAIVRAAAEIGRAMA